MTCGWHGSMMYTCLLQQLKESWEYDTAEERKTDAEKLKEKGNRYFKVSKRQSGYRRNFGFAIVSQYISSQFPTLLTTV